MSLKDFFVRDFRSLHFITYTFCHITNRSWDIQIQMYFFFAGFNRFIWKISVPIFVDFFHAMFKFLYVTATFQTNRFKNNREKNWKWPCKWDVFQISRLKFIGIMSICYYKTYNLYWGDFVETKRSADYNRAELFFFTFTTNMSKPYI